jgi:type II secretory pathway component PulF
MVLDTLVQKIKQLFFTSKDQQAFLEDLAALIDDGITATQAVEIIGKVSTGIKAEVTRDVLERIAEGKYLADGLVGWLPNSLIEIIRAGEEGGTLVKTLQVASHSVTRKNTAINTLLNALTYPLIVVAMGLGVSVFINNSVLQSFAAIKPVADWPLISQNAVAFASFVQQWWWAVLLGIVGGFFLLGLMLRTYIGEGRKYIDKLPLLSLYRQFVAGQFMEVMGLLLSNGVILKKALKIMQYNAPPYLGAHLLTMEYRLSGGKENIAEVLDTGLIPNHDLMRLRVIAQGKGFEHALLRQGARATDVGMKRVQTAARLFGGILLGVGALIAAFMILSIYSAGSVLAS